MIIIKKIIAGAGFSRPKIDFILDYGGIFK